eukprot:2760680-Rhodomonas_salina.1
MALSALLHFGRRALPSAICVVPVGPRNDYAWYQTQQSGSVNLSEPSRVWNEHPDRPFDVDAFKKAVKEEEGIYMQHVPAAKLEVYANNKKLTRMSQLVEELPVGNREENPLIVRYPPPKGSCTICRQADCESVGSMIWPDPAWTWIIRHLAIGNGEHPQYGKAILTLLTIVFAFGAAIAASPGSTTAKLLFLVSFCTYTLHGSDPEFLCSIFGGRSRANAVVLVFVCIDKFAEGRSAFGPESAGAQSWVAGKPFNK